MYQTAHRMMGFMPSDFAAVNSTLPACAMIPNQPENFTRHDDRFNLNRPSMVEQDFKNFTSGERIDTCIMIQKESREKTDINAKRLTSMMFEVSAFC